MNRVRPEAEAEGSPALELRDEELEAVSDILADMLIAAIERAAGEREGAA